MEHIIFIEISIFIDHYIYLFHMIKTICVKLICDFLFPEINFILEIFTLFYLQTTIFYLVY